MVAKPQTRHDRLLVVPLEVNALPRTSRDAESGRLRGGDGRSLDIVGSGPDHQKRAAASAVYSGSHITARGVSKSRV